MRALGVLCAMICFGGVSVSATEYELFPNPNTGANTITILSGDVATNNAETFENFGAIVVQDGATLRNITEMDILFDEDGGTGGISTVSIEAGGILEVLADSKMNFDSISHFNVSGTVNNDGDISSDWSMQFAVGSVINNDGLLTNKQGGTVRGVFNNAGVFFNSTPAYDTGGFFQQIGDFTNLSTGTVINHGEFLNFTTLTNHGAITNTVFLGGGIGRGILRNMGTLNNEVGGVVTNRHRWFNTGALNNGGLFVNHLGGLGIGNSEGASIHNLSGGTFQNDRVINSSGSITNAGLFLTGSIAGTGSYLQTAGETVVTDTLEGLTINIEGGLLSGHGTVRGVSTVGLSARVAPGYSIEPGPSVGRLDFDGDLSMAGVLVSEIESLTAYDSISVSGVLDLGALSSLELILVGGDAPGAIPGATPGSGLSLTPLDTFTIASAGSIVGDFDSIIGQSLSNGLLLIPQIVEMAEPARMDYNLVVGIPGDFNLDGQVDVADLSVWATGFGATDTYFQFGDADLNGQVDVADLSVWATHFGQTPADYAAPMVVVAISSAIAIPEPMSLGLMGLGVLGAFKRRRRGS